jgi:hypothetical protein
MPPQKKTAAEANTSPLSDFDGVYRSSGSLALRHMSAQSEAQPLTHEALRLQVHAQMCVELAERLATDPTPTDEERRMGTYVQMIEPQVRNAVLKLREKGYDTNSSGFNGARTPGTQSIQFLNNIELTEDTLRRIAEAGAQTEEWNGKTGEIRFSPATPDFDQITSKWNKLVDLLPNREDYVPTIVSYFNNTAFVINALHIGMTPEQLAPSPFATEDALREGMDFVGYAPQ